MEEGGGADGVKWEVDVIVEKEWGFCVVRGIVWWWGELCGDWVRVGVGNYGDGARMGCVVME